MTKTKGMLPVGARVCVQQTHKGMVAGYGFTCEAVAPYGAGHDVATRPCYLVQLDEMIVVKRDEGGREAITAAISVLVAHPDNVKEV